MSGTRFCLCGIVIALVLNGCAGRASRLPVDSAELRTQPQIFVVHQEARTGFLIENTGYRLMGPTILGGILQGNQSASVQFNLKLEDPVIHGKERLARTLRENLDLKNMTIVPKAYQKEDGQLAEIYQGGVVLHLQTVRWGMDNQRAKYSVVARLQDMRATSTMWAKACEIVVDKDKEAPSQDELYANDGALLKVKLRAGAETCADQLFASLVEAFGRSR
jgi:hypothetical protein